VSVVDEACVWLCGLVTFPCSSLTSFPLAGAARVGLFSSQHEISLHLFERELSQPQTERQIGLSRALSHPAVFRQGRREMHANARP
jgi:hypothetical protein